MKAVRAKVFLKQLIMYFYSMLVKHFLKYPRLYFLTVIFKESFQSFQWSLWLRDTHQPLWKKLNIIGKIRMTLSNVLFFGALSNVSLFTIVFSSCSQIHLHRLFILPILLQVEPCQNIRLKEFAFMLYWNHPVSRTGIEYHTVRETEQTKNTSTKKITSMITANVM